MKLPFRSVGVAALLMLTAGAAPAAVTVAFSHPENYRDMPFSPSERDQVIKNLGDYFGQLGARLPPGQDLRVDVLELDLAGRIHPNFRGGQEVRILRGGADWPRMRVRYSLLSNGQLLARGEDDISDMMYLDRIDRASDGDSLHYEKRMIDDWFTKKFAPRKRG